VCHAETNVWFVNDNFSWKKVQILGQVHIYHYIAHVLNTFFICQSQDFTRESTRGQPGLGPHHGAVWDHGGQHALGGGNGTGEWRDHLRGQYLYSYVCFGMWGHGMVCCLILSYPNLVCPYLIWSCFLCYLIIHYLIVSGETLSYLILSYLLCYLTLSQLILSYLIRFLHFLTLAYLTLPFYRILSSCVVLSYLFFSYLTLPILPYFPCYLIQSFLFLS
jgi:hypothetical protein